MLICVTSFLASSKTLQSKNFNLTKELFICSICFCDFILNLSRYLPKDCSWLTYNRIPHLTVVNYLFCPNICKIEQCPRSVWFSDKGLCTALYVNTSFKSHLRHHSALSRQLCGAPDIAGYGNVETPSRIFLHTSGIHTHPFHSQWPRFSIFRCVRQSEPKKTETPKLMFFFNLCEFFPAKWLLPPFPVPNVWLIDAWEQCSEIKHT